MNIIPALMKQKALLITGAVVLIILIAGAAYVSQNTDGQQSFQFPGLTQPEKTIAVSLNAVPVSETQTDYSLRFAEDEATALTGMSIRLVSATSTLTDQDVVFTLNPALAEEGWQAPLSVATVESDIDSTSFVYELALLRISTEQSVVAPGMTLGSFSILGNTDGVEFVLDPSISTAILQDGTEVQLTLAR